MIRARHQKNIFIPTSGPACVELGSTFSLTQLWQLRALFHLIFAEVVMRFCHPRHGTYSSLCIPDDIDNGLCRQLWPYVEYFKSSRISQVTTVAIREWPLGSSEAPSWTTRSLIAKRSPYLDVQLSWSQATCISWSIGTVLVTRTSSSKRGV
jgi:hypothetical protein